MATSTTPISQDQQQTSLQSEQPSVSNIATRNVPVKANPTVIRMSPPATLRNWKFHKPLLALGNQDGTIQIFNLNTGKLYRELKVHSYHVMGIEWIGLNAFISFGNSTKSYSYNPQSNNSVDSISELCVTELDTGQTLKLKSDASSCVQSVKVSHMRQYFIVVYKSNPFEIWDLDSLSLLRRLPKKFSSIVAAEWSPLYSKKVNHESNSGSADGSPLRENFVVANKLGDIYHFSITGNVVKEISRFPPESTMNKPVTAINWKSDYVVLGQDNGCIIVWDLGKKDSKMMQTTRGAIKKIRFAPGRGNMKVILLFEDGVDIWDIKRLRLLSSVTAQHVQKFEIIDADWSASDRPVALASNGLLLITDVDLRQLTSMVKQFSAVEDEDRQHQNSLLDSFVRLRTMG